MSSYSPLAIEWIQKLKSNDIKIFKFAELPENLKDKKAFVRARISGLLTKIEIDPKGVATWEITTHYNDK